MVDEVNIEGRKERGFVSIALGWQGSERTTIKGRKRETEIGMAELREQFLVLCEGEEGTCHATSCDAWIELLTEPIPLIAVKPGLRPL